METNSSKDTSTEPKKSESFFLHQYVAELRKKEWKTCCPFSLSGDSPDSNYRAERVPASLVPEKMDALLNNSEKTEASNSLKYSQVGNPEISSERKSCHSSFKCKIWDDALIFMGAIHIPPKLLNSKHMLVFAGVVIGNDAPRDVNGEASKPSSSKLKDGVQYQNEINTISEDTIAAGNDDDDDGAYTISDEERNLAGEKPKKFRLLSDILKDLDDAASADSDFSSESEDDSDEFTLDTSTRKKKGVRVPSKSGVVSKKKRGSRRFPERSCNRAKRMKPMASESSRKDPELVSKRPLRKTRTKKVDLEVMNKHKASSAEIIVCDIASGSQKVALSSLGGGENGSGTQKNSLISSGNKRKRVAIQDDSGRGVLKHSDGIRRRFTEEKSSRSTHGVKSTQLVQPTSASVYVQKSIREDSPSINNELMAALQLLRIFNSGATTHTSSKAATQDPKLSVSKGEISRGLEDKMPSASEPIVGQSHEEANMIIGSGLLQAEKIEFGTPPCSTNKKVSEFSTRDAKKFMRRGKIIRK